MTTTSNLRFVVKGMQDSFTSNSIKQTPLIQFFLPCTQTISSHSAVLFFITDAELFEKLKIRPSPGSTLSPCASPKMENFLNAIWNLKPRLMVVTEQESNANDLTLMKRLENALIFYGALFDCLEANVPKAREAERTIMERMLLGEEIKNIIACEGAERKERHEKVETWVRRLELAGLQRRPLSYARMLQATRPLQSFGRGYKFIEHNQCLFICWNDLPLYSISAYSMLA